MLEATGPGSKRRQAVLRWVLAISVLILASSRPAFADAPPAETESRELLREGFAALKKNDLEAAHAAFSGAWKKHQHFAVAFSLAEVEMRLGRYVEAAQHWQYVLANIPDDLADKRDQAAQQLEECRPQIGSLTVKVSAEGASVHVDGVHVGESPLGRELYVRPGDHELYAEKSAKRSPIRFFRISGGSKLSFELVVPEPAPQPQASPQGSSAPVAGSTSREAHPVSSSSLRTPTLIAGLVATVGAAAVGTAFVLKSNGASDDARAALDQAVAQSDPSLDPSTVCGVPDRPRSCETAFALQDDRDTFRDIAIGSFIASGVFAAGTAAAYWLWPRASEVTGVAVLLAPGSGQGGAAVTMVGRF